MRDKWVDNEVYFGPDRRRGAGANRLWRERRRIDESGDPPPLGALLRRLRVAVLSMSNEEHRNRALKFARAALAAADRLRLTACSEKIREANRILAVADPRDHAAIHRADALVVEAMTLMG